MAISHFSSCRMLPALHQPSCRLIQKGIPYANDKYTINLERDVLPVSGGKSKFVSQSSRPEVTRPLTSNSVRRNLTCLSELHEEKTAVQFQIPFGTYQYVLPKAN